MRHRLSKLDLLGYAREGVSTLIGVNIGPAEHDEWIEEMEKDRKEIERRIKLVEAQEAKKK